VPFYNTNESTESVLTC